MGRDVFYFLSDFPFQLTWVIKSQTGIEKEKQLWIRKKSRKQNSSIDDKHGHITKDNLINLSNELSSLSDCDLIIETITEDFQKKSDLFLELDKILRPDTIIASNTSSISIRSLVQSMERIDRFVGLHFFYPVKFKNLVEVNILPETSVSVVEGISLMLKEMNRNYWLFPEADHFIINRLFLPVQAEAYNIHKQENISFRLLDDLIKETLFPVGVFSFFDHVGIDVMYTSVSNYSSCYKDADFLKPLTKALGVMKDTNRLGVKSGQGFYNYSNEPPHKTLLQEENIDISQRKRIMERLLRSYLTTIFETVEKGILNQNVLEFIVMEYMAIEKSPFELAKEIGFTD